jgi:hypothetical protein
LNEPETPVAPPAPAVAPPPSTAYVTLIDGPPMSFAEWLRATRSAALGTEASYASSPPDRNVSSGARSVEESSAAANDARERAAHPLPEKPPEHGIARGRSGRLAAYAALAFTIGVLLGVLVMRRRRPRLPAAHQR